MLAAVVKIHLKCIFHVICDDITENTGCEPHGLVNSLVAPSGGVHCGDNGSKTKTRYNYYYLDRFQAVFII